MCLNILMNNWQDVVKYEFKLLGFDIYITYNNTVYEVWNNLKKLSFYSKDESDIPRYRKMLIPNIDGSMEDDILTEDKFKELLEWIK